MKLWGLCDAGGADLHAGPRSQSEQLIEELEKHGKTYEFVLIEGEGHAFSNEAKTIALMTKIDSFLARHL